MDGRTLRDQLYLVDLKTVVNVQRLLSSCTHRRPYNLYCVGATLNHARSINQSVFHVHHSNSEPLHGSSSTYQAAHWLAVAAWVYDGEIDTDIKK